MCLTWACFSDLVIISVLCSGVVGLMLLCLGLVCYDCYVCRLCNVLCWLFVRIFGLRVFGFDLAYFGCAYWINSVVVVIVVVV